LTTPDFTMSSESIDFGKVMVGTVSIAKLRLENTREVPCEWSYSPKTTTGNIGQSKDLDRFSVVPNSGILHPGQRITIEVIYTPIQEKSTSQKLDFKITHSQTSKYLLVKGTGYTKLRVLS